MNAEAMKISEFEKSFKTMGDRSIFDNLSIGDILVTDDNKSYHVINHGHAAILYDGDHIVEAVRDGVRIHKYNWVDTYNASFAARVK